MDPDPEDDLNHEIDQSDGFDIEDAFFTGSLIGYAYKEGKDKRRKQKDASSNEPPDID